MHIFLTAERTFMPRAWSRVDEGCDGDEEARRRERGAAGAFVEIVLVAANAGDAMDRNSGRRRRLVIVG